MTVQPDAMAKGEEALFKLRVTELDNNTCVLAVTCLHLVADGKFCRPARNRQRKHPAPACLRLTSRGPGSPAAFMLLVLISRFVECKPQSPDPEPHPGLFAGVTPAAALLFEATSLPTSRLVPGSIRSSCA